MNIYTTKRLYCLLAFLLFCVYAIPGNFASKSHIESSSHRQGYEAGKALDSDLNTSWIAAGSSPQWLMVDLGQLYSLSKIEQIFEKSSVWKFTVEGSCDGQTWLMLIDNTAGKQGHIFARSVSGIYRYVRLTVLESADGYPPSSKEFTISGTDCINLSKNTRMTSVLTSNKFYEPDKACDGNSSTFWCAPDKNYPHAITVDLEHPANIQYIRQVFKDYDIWKFRIEGSLDNYHWKNIADKSEGEKGHDFKIETKGKYRYIRLTVLGSDGDLYANSCEFEVYGLHENKTLQDYIIQDLSSHTQATASSIKDKDHSQYQAVDTDENSMWVSDPEQNGEQWLIVDLGNPCDISRIEQTFPGEDVWSFRVEGSNNKEDWKTIWNEKELEGENFSAKVKAMYRYLKLTVSDAKNSSIAGSKGFRVFGSGSPVREYWWQSQSGLNRYYNKFYNNRLADITAGLDSIKAKGFDVLEFSTVYEGDPAIWAGLGATNNYVIDSSLGTMEDFENLIKEAHKKDMKVIMFGNLGYCLDEAPFFLKACEDYKNNINSKERNWFHFSDQKHDDKWFWSEKAGAYYYSFWGNTDGAAGRVPSYNFNHQEWRDESAKILDFWSAKGLDGFFLDAPEVYDGMTPEIMKEYLVKVMLKYGMFIKAEGTSDIQRFIADYGFNGIQGFDLYGWGGESKSEVLKALRDGNPGVLDEKLRHYRDRMNEVNGVTLTPPMWEIEATAEERIFEIAFLTTTGTMFAYHFGNHRILPQNIMKEWTEHEQKRFFVLSRTQNNYAALSPAGLRVRLKTNDDEKFMAFKRTNKTGDVTAVIIMNFHDQDSTVTVDLKNSGIGTSKTPVNLLTGTSLPPAASEKYSVSVPAKSFLILGVDNQIQDNLISP